MSQANFLPPRNAMADRLPAFLQPLLTWLTSKALPGQQPLFRHTPRTQILTGFGMLVSGLLLSTLLVKAGGLALLLLLFPWILLVAGARYLQTNILHQASHSRLTGNPRLDRWLGDLISITVLIPSFAQYKAAHMPHHTPGTFATIEDSDFRFFRKLGFEPSLAMPLLWRRFWLALFGPSAHLTYLRVRLRSNLVKAGLLHAAATVFFHVGLAFALVHFAGWSAYLLAWLLPITVLFQISAILQYLTEHRWLLVRRPEESMMVYLNQLTIARFTGERPPQASAGSLPGLLRWAGWWFRMLTYHLFARTFIVQGPLGVHDFHHREPLNGNWPESVYERQRQIDSGNPRFADYQGVWGFHLALMASLQAISDFPELPQQAPLSGQEIESGFQSM